MGKCSWFQVLLAVWALSPSSCARVRRKDLYVGDIKVDRSFETFLNQVFIGQAKS